MPPSPMMTDVPGDTLHRAVLPEEHPPPLPPEHYWLHGQSVGVEQEQEQE